VIARARLRYLRGSAQKARLVIDQVRGKSVEEARHILTYSPKSAARAIKKVVDSAVANAQNKDPKLDLDDLVVARAVVDEGPHMKRIRHRSMGRVYQILKRTCHVTIDLDVKGGAAASAEGGR